MPKRRAIGLRQRRSVMMRIDVAEKTLATCRCGVIPGRVRAQCATPSQKHS